MIVLTDYVPPQYRINAFNCPNCNAFAHQRWSKVSWGESSRYVSSRHSSSRHVFSSSSLDVATCFKCRRYSLWYNEKMLFPHSSTAPLPNNDLPQDVKDDYLEARNILQYSPRGTCALLRLAIEKLSKNLGNQNKSLDDNISSLVKEGLSPTIQKSLDVVRVVGNKAVHPGEIDLKDKPETAEKLFRIVNIIAQQMITDKKEIDNLYDGMLTKGEKEHIKKRDEK